MRERRGGRKGERKAANEGGRVRLLQFEKVARCSLAGRL